MRRSFSPSSTDVSSGKHGYLARAEKGRKNIQSLNRWIGSSAYPTLSALSLASLALAMPSKWLPFRLESLPFGRLGVFCERLHFSGSFLAPCRFFETPAVVTIAFEAFLLAERFDFRSRMTQMNQAHGLGYRQRQKKEYQQGQAETKGERKVVSRIKRRQAGSTKRVMRRLGKEGVGTCRHAYSRNEHGWSNAIRVLTNGMTRITRCAVENRQGSFIDSRLVAIKRYYTIFRSSRTFIS